MKELFSDLREKSACGCTVIYTVDNSTDLITHHMFGAVTPRTVDLKGNCKNCSWRNLCELKKQAVEERVKELEDELKELKGAL